MRRFGNKCLFAGLVSKQQSTVPLHPKLLKIVNRETKEEAVRDYLPAKPPVPPGWEIHHSPGSSRFEMYKQCSIRSCGVEEIHVVSFLEQKQYEGTYRMDNGEREEQEYLNFSLFLSKPAFQGGLEFALTSIDFELTLDSLSIHRSQKSFLNSKRALGDKSIETTLTYRNERDSQYRGPMLNELDEDLSDEILDYLDERGINNAFAEFMISQAHFLEQNEYLNWLALLKKNSETKRK